jgi:hypothetical protein
MKARYITAIARTELSVNGDDGMRKSSCFGLRFFSRNSLFPRLHRDTATVAVKAVPTRQSHTKGTR